MPQDIAGQGKPDDWLYCRSVLQWLSDRPLSQQLPPLYRVFSAYSHLYFQLTQAKRLPGGRSLLRSLIRLQQLLPQDFCKLELANYEVFVDLLDPRFLQVVNELTRDDADTQALSSLLAPGDTFVDVGANHGSFSIVASQLVGPQGMVVAVEPQPRLVRALEQSLAANAPCPYQIFPVALGDREDQIDLLIPLGTSGSAGLYPTHSATHQHRTVSVPLRQFDHLVDWRSFPGKTVLKLDVEGSEYAFLIGAKQMLTALRPALIIEIHPGTLQASGTAAADLLSLLQTLGYTQYTEITGPQLHQPIAQLDTRRQRNVILTMA